MNANPDYQALEFPLILEKLQQHARCDGAKRALAALSPCLDEAICRRRMAETSAARKVLDACGAPPLAAMRGLEEIIALAEMGAMLTPGQLTEAAGFAAECARLTAYLKRGAAQAPSVAAYAGVLGDLSNLRAQIESRVGPEEVYDAASPALRDIRRQLARLEAQIKEKLQHILQSRKQFLAEGYITQRAGRYVLPVKRQYQSQFGGAVVEASGKGATVFMEPAAVANLQAERNALAVREDAEARRVLYELSAEVAARADELRGNMRRMEELDALFAKAKFSAAIEARAVEIGGERRARIVQGRHPLLDPAICVPLDFSLEEGVLGVIVTGPNTGGKTVALKTVGLFCLMAQCGLHVPCEEGSYLPLRDGYFCDVGDGQDMRQNLSTFSGHIQNVVRILESASRDSLVLLDELGSGTDPAEGMGLAIAVLEELRRRKCMFVVTTHYPRVKDYAERTADVLAARMAFDRETLAPLYRLEIGKSGESCALHIARRLGLAPGLLARAAIEAYGPQGGPPPAPAAMPAPASRLVRAAAPRKVYDPASKFRMGDSVLLLPQGEAGIVFRPADRNGEVTVQVKGVKKKVKHNRLKLRVAAEALYPPDYDFSILFDTVENRKARKVMQKRHDPDAVVACEPEP